MKNQNDLIISIVAAVLGIGFTVAFFFMKPEPVRPADPQPVVDTKVVYPNVDVSWANGLPGGGNSAGGGSGSPFGPGGGPSFGGAASGVPGGGKKRGPMSASM